VTTIQVKTKPGNVLVVHGRRVTDSPTSMPDSSHVRRHLQRGRLLLADQETEVQAEPSQDAQEGGNE